MIGTKIYRLNRIMVVVLEELNDEIVLHPTEAGLLTENFIEVVSRYLYILNERITLHVLHHIIYALHYIAL